MTIITPRWYQEDLIAKPYDYWRQGFRNVVNVAPTGAGKTFIKAFIAKEFVSRKQYVMVMAHRDILLSQISLSLAKLKLHHTLICSNKARKFITNLHITELGESFYNENAKICVASVKTLLNRNTTSWEALVGLWLMDEGHHVLANNSWGIAVSKFINAFGLGLTATPVRGDNKGLGRMADGVYDAMVLGPTYGDLIKSGDLCPYRLVRTPLSHIVHAEMKDVPNSSGDYQIKGTKEVLKRNYVYGDVVSTYKKFTMGRQGITFCRDIESSEEMAKAYRDQGVSAISLSSRDSEATRWEGIKKFEKGEYLQITNCDLFGEGFDVPICYAVSMASPTKSYGRYVQMWGRQSRNFPGKQWGWVFDHVGNVDEHLLPDNGLEWTLERRDKRKRVNNSSALRVTTCTNPECMSDYFLPASHCPWCGSPYEVKSINTILKKVDGELVEMSPEELEQLQRKKNKIMIDDDRYRKNVASYYDDVLVVNSMVKMHRNNRELQKQLEDKLRDWCYKMHDEGLTPTQARQQFLQIHDVDVVTAQTLDSKQTRELIDRIKL